mgnify:CR=1 FL=1
MSASSAPAAGKHLRHMAQLVTPSARTAGQSFAGRQRLGSAGAAGIRCCACRAARRAAWRAAQRRRTHMDPADKKSRRRRRDGKRNRRAPRQVGARARPAPRRARPLRATPTRREGEARQRACRQGIEARKRRAPVDFSALLARVPVLAPPLEPSSSQRELPPPLALPPREPSLRCARTACRKRCALRVSVLGRRCSWRMRLVGGGSRRRKRVCVRGRAAARCCACVLRVRCSAVMSCGARRAPRKRARCRGGGTPRGRRAGRSAVTTAVLRKVAVARLLAAAAAAVRATLRHNNLAGCIPRSELRRIRPHAGWLDPARLLTAQAAEKRERPFRLSDKVSFAPKRGKRTARQKPVKR